MSIIAVANQKGGVGKTTTVRNMGAALHTMGKKVLMVDLDQQGHLSRWLGWQQDGRPTISELIYQEVSGVRANADSDFVRDCPEEGVSYIPANKMLGGIYAILGSDGCSNTVLHRIFERAFFQQYDYILLDFPPALDNLLTSNALVCCTHLLIPVQAEKLAYEGVPGMLKHFAAIKQAQDIKPYMAGLLVTMYKPRTTMGQEVLEALRESYGTDLVFPSPVPNLQEAANSTDDDQRMHGALIKYKSSRVGQAYLANTKWLMARCEKAVHHHD